MRTGFLLCVFLLAAALSYSQQSIKVKKEFRFYPAAALPDTISRSSPVKFYLLVPESMKKSVSIYVENGKLDPLPGDSLFTLSYLTGMRYELVFVKEEGDTVLKPKSLVNGAASIPKNTIKIEAVNRREDKVLQTYELIVR